MPSADVRRIIRAIHDVIKVSTLFKPEGVGKCRRYTCGGFGVSGRRLSVLECSGPLGIRELRRLQESGSAASLGSYAARTFAKSRPRPRLDRSRQPARAVRSWCRGPSR